MIGIRVWLSLLCMCIGSAIISFYQRMLGGFQSDLSYVHEWLPFENEAWRESKFHLRNAQEKSNGKSEKVWARNINGLFDFREPKDGSIKSIALLGERNSGTRWIYGHLGMCFNYTLPVHRSLSRYKHWFQYNSSQIPSQTLVIAMFRDPIEWTWATRAVPHHAPRHLDLSWKEFVTKEWSMERLWKDEAWRDEQLKRNNNGRICQENFHYHEVVSCLTRPYPEGYWGPHRKHRFSQHQPFYEMRVNDPKGRPYSNILEMRADKIRNFMETSTYNNVDGFWHYRYESLLQTGTEELVQKIERATGMKRNSEKCNIYEPQNRRKRKIDADFVNYMVDHVDWDAEALIGYEKPDYGATELVDS